jgi:hypothetical protein
MTELECQQVYQELIILLQDLQLGWVVERIGAKVQGGREQLLLLIDAVERLVVDTIGIEGAEVNP